MTTTTAAPASVSARAPRLRVGGVLRSEFIKLRSLRSTWWCSAVVFALIVGLSVLLSAVSDSSALGGSSSQAADAQRALTVQAATVGVSFGELVAAVLGALVITGEFGTGMIRSTLASVPRRVEVLGAKALVLALWLFVLGLVSVFAAALIDLPLLTARGLDAQLAEYSVLLPLVGAAGFLALSGLLSFVLGVLIRNTAGAIATALGVVFVLPIVVNILGAVTNADWVRNVDAVLPTSAGGRMYAYTAATTQQVPGVLVLEPWQGALVLLAWVVALAIPGVVLFSRRDV